MVAGHTFHVVDVIGLIFELSVALEGVEELSERRVRGRWLRMAEMMRRATRSSEQRVGKRGREMWQAWAGDRALCGMNHVAGSRWSMTRPKRRAVTMTEPM